MTEIPDLLIIHPSDAPAEGASAGEIAPSAGGRADPLSDALASIRLTAALLFAVEASSPWRIDVPHTKHYAPLLLPKSQRIFSYHIQMEGGGLASIPGVDPVPYEAGDIILFPQGDAYSMMDRPDAPPELDFDQTIAFMGALAQGALPFVVLEGGGGAPRSRTVCGFFGCDAEPFNPVLESLPRMLILRGRTEGRRDLLDRLAELTIEEAQAQRPGGQGVNLRLSELMFVEVLRRYVGAPGPKPPGWLAALGDPPLARALAAIHARPSENWSLEALSSEAGLSKSALATRFSESVGQPPLRYLTLWRMQLAANALTESETPVGEVARQLGYGAEEAFSRRFKQIVGVSPSAWRRNGRRKTAC